MWLLIKNIHEKEKILQSLLKWLVETDHNNRQIQTLQEYCQKSHSYKLKNVL